MHNRGRWLALPVLVAVSIAIAAPAISTGAPTALTADLKGQNEVPDEGDKNGRGTADVTLKPKRRKVCFVLEISKLTDATAAHIHKGAEGAAGPVKVTLFESTVPGDGSYDGCAKQVRRKLIRRIKRKPANYYVNVHSSDFPNGAIRGQLERPNA